MDSQINARIRIEQCPQYDGDSFHPFAEQTYSEYGDCKSICGVRRNETVQTATVTFNYMYHVHYGRVMGRPETLEKWFAETRCELVGKQDTQGDADSYQYRSLFLADDNRIQ